MKRRIILFAFAVIASGLLFAGSGCQKKASQQGNPTDIAQVEVEKGISLTVSGSLDQAMSHFQKAMQLDPKFPRAWCGMGSVYREKKDYGKAIEHYKKAVELDPKYVVCFDNMGIAYTSMQKYDEAKQAFDKAMEIDPQYANVHFNQGLMYKQMNDDSKAIEELQKFASLSTDQKKVDEVESLLAKLKKAGSPVK